MKKITAALALLLLAGGLTACGPSQEELDRAQERSLERQRELIEIGKDCFDKGGNWEYDTFFGKWSCSFVQEKDE